MSAGMTRRAALGGLTAVLVPLARAVAQSPQKMLRVGYVTLLPRSAQHDAFVKRMGELGYQEGANFAFDFVHIRSLDDYAAGYRELTARGCDILIAAGNEAALSAAVGAAGNQVPVVFFALDFDPFAKGFVTNLAKPGGNMTGIFVRQIELAKKRVELARQAMPEARALWLLWDAVSRDQADAAAEVARTLGFEPHLVEASGEPPDYSAALAPMAETPGAPLVIPATPRFYRDRVALLALLLERRIPAIGAFPEHAESGALLSYGVTVTAVLRDVALYVDRIAKGAKPADIPIEQPTHFDMIINLKTAKALNLEISPVLIARADGVIE
ncbi:MAG TPA: ABC transporter substrate-binding protein [Stellaceae bacterium]|nr:ABC transporter substrate-binding protein [Stellaceae bacterium]